MSIVTGAMSSLLPKLAELAVGEYKLQKGVKGEIKQLEEELISMTTALHKVAEVPPDQLDEQTKIWARDVKELSYDIEDKVDTFMLCGKQEHKHAKTFSLKGLTGRATDLYKKAKANHKMHYAIKDIMDQVKNVAERRDRHKIDNIAARPVMVDVDPRLESMQRKAKELVGIAGPKNELTKRLLEQHCSSSSTRHQSNIISIVGFGGLGKTTLANSLLQDLKAKFDCQIFVSVSLNPDIKKIFKNILLQLDENKYSHLDEGWEVNQLIDKIKEFLQNRRCLCVIDDLWKESAWDAIKLAFQDCDPGTKIIITTRNRNVAEHVCGGIYELKPLSDDDSRELFSMRIFDRKDGCPPNLVEVAGKIIKKCGGVPLAIITTASLLASRPMHLEEWEGVNKSIGSGLGHSLDVNKMRKILSLSYNDLPFHLKTCLLSLSKYPEDHLIRKDVLVWTWIAEGFIKQEETQGPAGKSLQEIAESYFNDLINRSLIQPARGPSVPSSEEDGHVHCCQVHDMVLELINQLSAKEGFLMTLLSEDGQQTSTLTSAMQKTIRRLSLNNKNSIKIESYAASSKVIREQLSKLRSLDLFGKVKSIPPLSCFHVLRVLQVDGCSDLDSNHLNGLGKLHLLRFLRLHGLEIKELPESIGELESLETLDIRRKLTINSMELLLPVSLAKLGKLVRLIGTKVGLPDGLALGNMTSLREVRGIWATLHALTEIGKLEELKVLELHFPRDYNMNEKIVKCLQSFPSLQVFIIWYKGLHFYPVNLMARLPSGLRTFSSFGCYFMESFPKWTKTQLSYLTILHLGLYTIRVLPEHLEQLAELPSLYFLNIRSITEPDEQEMLSNTSGFPCLTHLYLHSAVLFIKFQQGAMPKLQNLRLEFAPVATIKHFQTNTFECGLDNLPSLRHVDVRLCQCCPEVEDAILEEVSDHPNHPSVVLDRQY